MFQKLSVVLSVLLYPKPICTDSFVLLNLNLFNLQADVVSSTMAASKREDTTTIDEERNIKTIKKRKKAGKNKEEEIPATIIQRVRPITTETFKIGPFNFYKGEIHIVDRISRLLFPFLFLVFNFSFFIIHHFEKNSVL